MSFYMKFYALIFWLSSLFVCLDLKPFMLFEYHPVLGHDRRAKRLGLIYNRSALTIFYASHDHHSQIS